MSISPSSDPFTVFHLSNPIDLPQIRDSTGRIIDVTSPPGMHVSKLAIPANPPDRNSDPFETAARAAGWKRGGDNGGIIFHEPTWGSWKAAISWEGTDQEPSGTNDKPRIYDTWQDCCLHEEIAATSAGNSAT